MIRMKDADKAGAVELIGVVYAATDGDITARELASQRWLSRTAGKELRDLGRAAAWLRRQLASHATGPGETVIHGSVERGRWTGFVSQGVEDAEFEYDDWPGRLHGWRDDDGTVHITTPDADED